MKTRITNFLTESFIKDLSKKEIEEIQDQHVRQVIDDQKLINTLIIFTSDDYNFDHKLSSMDQSRIRNDLSITVSKPIDGITLSSIGVKMYNIVILYKDSRVAAEYTVTIRASDFMAIGLDVKFLSLGNWYYDIFIPMLDEAIDTIKSKKKESLIKFKNEIAVGEDW
jgi:hypothetical protein